VSFARQRSETAGTFVFFSSREKVRMTRQCIN
jgi:hypothetical protein